MHLPLLQFFILFDYCNCSSEKSVRLDLSHILSNVSREGRRAGMNLHDLTIGFLSLLPCHFCVEDGDVCPAQSLSGICRLSVDL